MAVYESDLFLLQKLFAPKAELVLIMDPSGFLKGNYPTGYLLLRTHEDILNVKKLTQYFTLINLSEIPVSAFPFETDKIDCIISLNPKDKKNNVFKAHQLYYFKNEFGTIRWIFLKNLKRTSFFNIHGYEIVHSPLFEAFSWLALKLGQPQWIVDDFIVVLNREAKLLNEIDKKPFDTYSIFCSKFLTEEKIIIQLLSKKQEITHYVKFGLTKESQEVLENENNILSEIRKKNFQHFTVAENEYSEPFLYLSNILSKKVSSESLKTIHFKALGEIYKAFKKRIPISELLRNDQTLTKVNRIKSAIKKREIPSGISGMASAELINSLVKIINTFEPDKEIAVSLAHNDFTSWNVFKEKDKLAILDWELAQYDIPIFFDVFEFIIHHQEQEDQPKAEIFFAELDKYLRNDQLQKLRSDYNIDLFLYLKLYLVLRFLRLFDRYVSKKVLPYNLNWKLHFWNEILKHVIENEN